MADQSSGKQTDAAMLTDVAKRYEVIINNGAEEMRLWIKDGKLQTPTLLYWGKMILRHFFRWDCRYST